MESGRAIALVIVVLVALWWAYSRWSSSDEQGGMLGSLANAIPLGGDSPSPRVDELIASIERKQRAALGG